MERIVHLGLTTIILLIFSHISFGQEDAGKELKFSGGVIAGYNRGLGFQVNATASNFAKEFPFKLRFGLGYTFLNPGDALDVRRIFINNNTNGTPEKNGRSFDFRLDFLVSRTIFNIEDSYFIFGPRFSTFNGDFKYVGGNEDFEVKSHQWGIGAGIENYFKMTQNLCLVIAFGLDFYLPSTLTGHDTSYSPDNDNVNPTRDNQNNDVYFLYKDANKAIRQPFLMPHVMLGVSFGL
jgi:hypothetical protein